MSSSKRKSSNKPAKPAKKSKSQEPTSSIHRSGKRAGAVVETGILYFFYRPKMGVTDASKLDDVQKLFMLMKPSNTLHKPEDSAGTKLRLFIIPSKQLPHHHQVHWAFADVVSDDTQEVHTYLDKKEYDTKTRGHRTLKSGRICGEGLYELIQHDDKCSLAYVLEVPSQPGEVQKAFNIGKEGSFLLQVKNPKIHFPARPDTAVVDLAEKDKHAFPKALQAKFKGTRVPERRFTAAEPSFLDFDHTQLLLIGEKADLKKEFGEEGEQLEADAAADEKKAKATLHGHMEDKPMNELDMHDEAEHEPKAAAALKGKWPGGKKEPAPKATKTKAKAKTDKKAKSATKAKAECDKCEGECGCA